MIVRKIAQDIDHTIEVAQERYRKATTQVCHGKLLSASLSLSLLLSLSLFLLHSKVAAIPILASLLQHTCTNTRLHANTQVGALTEQDLAELKSYHTPHSRVRLIMMAVCVMFGVPMDWRSAQRMLVSHALSHSVTEPKDCCTNYHQNE